jgi:radical SAM superfamily enzyme YgiQ (UPF0313 family)
MPAYDLVNVSSYASITSSRKRFVTYIRSRGCPYNCTFCSVIAMFERKYRVQSPRRTIRDLEQLKSQYGIEEVLFKDSEFIIKRENCKNLCELMIERGLNLKWSCGARVDSVDPELLALMKRAGCDVISYGAESGSAAVLGRLKKKITPEQICQALAWTRQAGIKSAVSFIIGHQGETEAELMETYEFTRRIEFDYISVSYLTPFPGSELFDDCQHIYEKSRGDFSIFDELGNLSVNLTDGISDETLVAMRKKIYRNAYFRWRFLRLLIGSLNPTTLKKYVVFTLVLLKEIIGNRFRKAGDHEPEKGNL